MKQIETGRRNERRERLLFALFADDINLFRPIMNRDDQTILQQDIIVIGKWSEN